MSQPIRTITVELPLDGLETLQGALYTAKVRVEQALKHIEGKPEADRRELDDLYRHRQREQALLTVLMSQIAKHI